VALKKASKRFSRAFSDFRAQDIELRGAFQWYSPARKVEAALEKGSCLETVCSYCQNKIKLDARTFEPMP
jgi:hypothetical protein